jgi:P4 family phage/plasmid primase-like protien
VTPLETVIAKLDGARRNGSGWTARCPAHDDRNPSLSISEGDDGRVLMKCHAGNDCNVDAIASALGLDIADLFPPRENTRRQPQIVDTYPYVDEDGDLLFEVVRKEGKKFTQRRPDGSGGWVWKLGDTRRVLYHLPQLIAAVADGRRVFIVEGEKDVHAIERCGEVATCNPQGAGKWHPAYNEPLRGADVVIVADRDRTGYAHARAVAKSVSVTAASVELVEPVHGKDAADHLGAGYTVDDFQPWAAKEHAHDEHVADPARFFDRVNGLLVQTLADAVRERVQLARLQIHRDADADDVLWHYRDGVWRPGGSSAIERAVGDLLGERLRHAHVSNTVLAIRTSALPVLPDGPPHREHINFANGMLRWADDVLEPHDPDHCSTVQVAVPWQPDATCPVFLDWLAEVFPVDCTDFAFELLGYLLMNGNPMHKAFMLRGTGRNGKGTFLRIGKALLGPSNCAAIPLQTLGENRFAAAELHTKLANVAGDLDARHVEDTSVFKMVTGEDSVYAERKYGHPFRFVPWAVPIFSANSTPSTSDTSHGYLSRWEVLPFPVDLTGRTDSTIEETIKANELPGIAVLAVDGLRRLMDRGRFDRPASVADALDAFAADVDQVRAWINERCVRDGDAWTERGTLHTAYKSWAVENDRGVLGAGTFYDRLEVAGWRPSKRSGTRGFVGLRIRLVDEPVDVRGRKGQPFLPSPVRAGERVEKLPLSAPDGCPVPGCRDTVDDSGCWTHGKIAS